MLLQRLGRSAALFAVVLAAAVLGTRAWADESPAQPAEASPVIDRFHAVLLDVMKNATALGLEGRKTKLGPALDATYDFPAMAQRSLSTHWAELTPEQRDHFVEVFRAMTLRTYAARFDGYDGERFETLAQEPSIANTVIVRSVLHAKDEDVHLDYRMRATPAGFRVIDVYLSGTVSELALRRSEYTSVFERDGFDALIAALERKISDAPGASPARNSDSRLK
ncbi:MAG TPA: ABC transporter substrate-binding protein [Myxococcota bacterium]|nr:ABC transporter substrate-binding protein [Myxococcota bacterium]